MIKVEVHRIMSDSKRKLCRDLFVVEGKPLIDIVFEVDVNTFELEIWHRQEDWAAQREAYVAQGTAAVASGDALYEHERIMASLLIQIRVQLEALKVPDIDRLEISMIRAKVETLKSAAEAARNTIETHREVRGINKHKPSLPDTSKQAPGVRYTVALPPISTDTPPQQ